MKQCSRRNFLGKLLTIPVGLCLSENLAWAALRQNQVKITDIKAMQLDFQFDGCLLKIETDSGYEGYGETGVNGNIARAHIKHMMEGAWPSSEEFDGGPAGLVGADPLSIEYLYYRMTKLQHPMMAPLSTISGIDIALWDLAGKITGQPVYKLLGGPFRDGCPLYSHGDALENMLDPAACREWVDYIKQQPEGFRFFKFNIDQAFTVQRPFHPPVTSDELKKLHQGFSNIREAAGDEIDIGVACHGEFDTPSSIAIAETLEPLNIKFLEDPLNVPYSEGWATLYSKTKVPILTGEKLVEVRGFKPFLENQAVDIIHPDVSFAGGITGCKRIAEYAALTRIPVALHNVGSLVRTYATAHLSMAIQDFYRSESWLGRGGRLREQMSADGPPVVENGMFMVPEKPGLGLSLDEGFLKAHLAEGEPWWG